MDQVAQIREKVDIVSFIADYIPLKKAGRNFHTQCPFHSEKTPSFVVSPERQIWHCFGCQKGGDVFTFLIEYERLEFIEALRILAKKTGIELAERQFDKTISTQKDRLYVLNRTACEFYHYVLTQHKVGEKALDYLVRTRKINNNLIKTFQIGYSPKSGTILCNYLLQKKNYSAEDIQAAGLGYMRMGKMSDFFVNRIMFPLTDHRGNIIGFSGRIFESADENVSKYINTRETLIYHKGSVFFGLDSAKEDIKKQNKAIIMEGEFDVISSFSQGIKNAIAVKGTALTENQVILVGRFAQKVALCFDGDLAGQEAIKRSLPALEKKGITTSVIVLSNAKDADEAIHKDPVSFKKSVESDVHVYDYLLQKITEKYDKNTGDGKKKIGEELLPLFVGIDNEIVKEHYVRRLSQELNTSFESLEKQIEKLQKKEVISPQVSVVKEKRDRQEIIEEYVVALILQHKNPSEVLPFVEDVLKLEFKIPAYKKILEALKRYFQNHTALDNGIFVKNLPSELISAFDTCFLLPLSDFEDSNHYMLEFKKTIEELRQVAIRASIKLLGEKIKEHDKNANHEEVERLQQQLITYTNLLKNT